MSNMLHLNRLCHFQLPDSLVTNSGPLWKMNGVDLKLYIFLFYLSQRRSTISFFLSAKEIEHRAGVSGRSLTAARGGLEEKRLIDFKRESNGYTYTLLNPATGKPLMNSTKGKPDSVDFDTLSPSQLKKYYLHHLGAPVEITATKISTICPFHSDSSPSMEINLSKGSTWLCHGCGRKGRLVAFEIEMATANGDDINSRTAYARVMDVLRHTGAIDAATGQPQATYPYEDKMGRLLYEVLRYQSTDGKKEFRQRRPDPNKPGYYIWDIAGVPTVLYGLPQVVTADIVIVVEGEKDVMSLRRLHLDDDNMKPIAITTSPMGAGHWQDRYAECLRGKNVVIHPDADVMGRKYADAVYNSLRGIAKEVRIREFPAGFKDASEYLEEHGLDEYAQIAGTDWVRTPTQI
jgi:5S rRNA maturation endonuclease (ribonuclease M5)